jgi:hypothetical protein
MAINSKCLTNGPASFGGDLAKSDKPIEKIEEQFTGRKISADCLLKLEQSFSKLCEDICDNA